MGGSCLYQCLQNVSANYSKSLKKAHRFHLLITEKAFTLEIKNIWHSLWIDSVYMTVYAKFVKNFYSGQGAEPVSYLYNLGISKCLTDRKKYQQISLTSSHNYELIYEV